MGAAVDFAPMHATPSVSSPEGIVSPLLDRRLVQWMAIQAEEDRYARLLDAGADADAQKIELATVFVDLPARSYRQTLGGSGVEALALSLLVGPWRPGEELRWLAMGGPGSGKSTLTTMLAQVLRLGWVDGQVEELPVELSKRWAELRLGLMRVWEAVKGAGSLGILPVRINLPMLSRWIGAREQGISLWDYLAWRMNEDLAREGILGDAGAEEVQAWLLGSGSVFWILDGLDEVPVSSGRRRVLELIRGVVFQGTRPADRMVVTTRPEGYQREFDALDELELLPLPEDVALGYAEGLLRVWGRGDRVEAMRGAFEKAQVKELLRTPLHTTMGALLVANQGELPSARALLFRDYFDTILRRELNKPDQSGIRREDEAVLRALHERAGLVLHVRSQKGASARASLRRREIREILREIYREQGYGEGELRGLVDRIMRFAMDRLVLLLHFSAGEYGFGIRSLQEYFAARALMQDDTSAVKKRLEAIAENAHWINVIGLVASECALMTDRRGQRLAEVLVGICQALNKGEVGGEVAKRCFLGSTLALTMLGETRGHGYPLLHDRLWGQVLELAAEASRPIGFVASEPKNSQLRLAQTHLVIGAAVADWEVTNGDTYRRDLLRYAEEHLHAGGESAVDGWRLLYPLLREKQQEAIDLAEKYAPATADEAIEMVEAMRAARKRLAPWLAHYIESHEDWLLPSVYFTGCEDEGRPFVFLYSEGLRIRRELRSGFLLVTANDRACIGALPSVDVDSEWWGELASLMQEFSAQWAAWKRLAMFLADPTHTNLADLLEAVCDDKTLDQLKGWQGALPWPLLACLSRVDAAAALSQLASQARAGAMGTLDDWRAAETRWRASPVFSLNELTNALLSPLPFTADIATQGIVLTPFFVRGSPESPSTFDKWCEALLDIARKHHSQVHIRGLLTILAAILPERAEVPIDIARLADEDLVVEEPAFHAVLTLAPELDGPDADAWFDLLDARGREGRNWGVAIKLSDWHRSRAESIIKALIERIVARPDQWGLLDALLCMLATSRDADLSMLKVPPLSEDAPPRARVLHAVVETLGGPEASTMSQVCMHDDGFLIDGRQALAVIFANRIVSEPDPIPLLCAALDAAPPPRRDIREALIGSLFTTHQRALHPSFATAESWQSHDLPEPFLPDDPPLDPPPRLATIHTLQSIRLFKSTPTIDTPFPPLSADRGQWIVLVGENGVGKTTLLRSLALAMATPAVANKLLDERVPLLTNGDEGVIAIELDTGRLAISIRREERTETIESSTPHAPRPWIVGYGVRRGNARGEKEPEIGPIGELHSLFDRPPSLHNAIQWLGALDADVLREKNKGTSIGRADIWRAVVHALRTLLPGVRDISVEDAGVVLIDHASFGRVRLDALSDGYLTTAGWIIDMIARWIDRQRELDEIPSGDILRQITGFVLLDEIDLHLHPIWQMRIIEDVRRLFPRLSFIVTTHNPLTLQGARPGEVYVMRRKDDGGIELVQRDIRPGQDVDRVLFEQFGVEHTFDRDTRDMLARHRDMLARGLPREHPDRASLEAQLAARLGDVGETLKRERDATLGPVAPLRKEERSLLAPYLKNKS